MLTFYDVYWEPAKYERMNYYHPYSFHSLHHTFSSENFQVTWASLVKWIEAYDDNFRSTFDLF